MASVSVVAPQVLQTGEDVRVDLPPTSEQMTLRLTSDPQGSGVSTQVRMYLISPGEGGIRLSPDILINGGESRQMTLERIPQALELVVECRLGRSRVSVTNETDLDKIDAQGGSVKQGDIDPGVGAKVVRFDGLAAPGLASTTPASVAGERVARVWGTTPGTGATVGAAPGDFEPVISSAGDILQIDGADLSANDYWAELLPPLA